MKYFDWSPEVFWLVPGSWNAMLSDENKFLGMLVHVFLLIAKPRGGIFTNIIHTGLFMLKWSISSKVFLSCLKDHLFQESSFKNRGLNVEHPGKRHFDVIRKGRLYIKTPVSFLDESCWKLVNGMFISLIYFCCWSSHLEGGGETHPTISHFHPTVAPRISNPPTFCWMMATYATFGSLILVRGGGKGGCCFQKELITAISYS